jgi:hypothetical protein
VNPAEAVNVTWHMSTISIRARFPSHVLEGSFRWHTLGQGVRLVCSGQIFTALTNGPEPQRRTFTIWLVRPCFLVREKPHRYFGSDEDSNGCGSSVESRAGSVKSDCHSSPRQRLNT